MSCVIEKRNGSYAVVDMKYGDVQGTYADEGFAIVAAFQMGYVVVN